MVQQNQYYHLSRHVQQSSSSSSCETQCLHAPDPKHNSGTALQFSTKYHDQQLQCNRQHQTRSSSGRQLRNLAFQRTHDQRNHVAPCNTCLSRLARAHSQYMLRTPGTNMSPIASLVQSAPAFNSHWLLMLCRRAHPSGHSWCGSKPDPEQHGCKAVQCSRCCPSCGLCS